MRDDFNCEIVRYLPLPGRASAAPLDRPGGRAWPLADRPLCGELQLERTSRTRVLGPHARFSSGHHLADSYWHHCVSGGAA